MNLMHEMNSVRVLPGLALLCRADWLLFGKQAEWMASGDQPFFFLSGKLLDLPFPGKGLLAGEAEFEIDQDNRFS